MRVSDTDTMDQDYREWPNAMLTEADRRYLLDEADPDDYADYDAWCRQRRQQIRERVRQSLIEFQLVAEVLPPEDKLEIIKASDDEFETAALGEGLTQLVSVLGLSGPGDAEDIITTGLERGLQELEVLGTNRHVEYTVEIGISRDRGPELPELLTKFNADDEHLSETELRSLLARRLISARQFDEAIRSD
jgi:hypothetical protein